MIPAPSVYTTALGGRRFKMLDKSILCSSCENLAKRVTTNKNPLGNSDRFVLLLLEGGRGRCCCM